MQKLLRALPAVCLVAFSAALPLSAAAQFAKPKDAIEYRESVMTVMSSHFGRLAPVMRGQQPFDAAQVKADVALVATLSKLPWAAFGPGTEGGRAKDAVWKDGAKFKQAAERMEGEVAKLNAAAQTGDLAQIRTAYGAAAASCKACHDDFRNRSQ